MVHYAFRARNDFVAGREHNLDGCRENEEPGEPFLTPRLSTALATMTRWRDISRPFPRTAGGHVGAVLHFGSGSHAFVT